MKISIFVFSSVMSLNLLAADLYVSPRGNNQNPGTKDAPFQTILRASQLAKPGTTVYVAPGTYSGGFQTKASGTQAAPIVYVSESKWKAIIVPPARSSRDMGWDNRGHHVTIKDFLVDGAIDPTNGPLWTVGINVGGTNNKVIGCYVKNIFLKGDPDSGGGAGILLDSWYGYNDMHALNNVVTNIGPGTRHYQGIYMTSTGSIKNNIVFNVRVGAGIHLWHDARNVDIINNTTVGNGNGIVLGGGNYIRARAPADFFNVQNNIVYGNTYGINQQGDNGKNNFYKNNLVYNNTYNFYKDFQSGKATHTGTISEDPKFVKYALNETGDFSLQKGSPAIDRGLSDALAPATDYTGLKRPQGLGIDIGAFEYPEAFPTSPLIKVSSAALRFPRTNVGKVSATQTLTITSVGSAPLILRSLKVSHSDFVLRGGTCVVGRGLAPTKACTIIVAFSPKHASVRSGVLAIENNSSSQISIPLTGTGTVTPQAKPGMRISVSMINFSNVKINRVSGTRTITVTNSGTAPLVFNQYFKFSGPFGFAGTGTCKINVSYAPGQSCTASAAFMPKVIGRQTGSLSFVSNAGSTSIELIGIGTK